MTYGEHYDFQEFKEMCLAEPDPKQAASLFAPDAQILAGKECERDKSADEAEVAYHIGFQMGRAHFQRHGA